MKIHLPDVIPGMPVHPFTGLSAIGYGKRGPIWPLMGGAEDGDEPEADDVDDDAVDADATDEAADADEGTDAGADQLRDAGKQALDRMKERLKAANDARKVAEAKLAEATKPKPGPPARKPAPKVDAKPADQPDSDAIRVQVTAEVNASMLRGRAMDKVEAKAARLFADPEDAVALLRAKADDFIDGDQIDTDAITAALDELLLKKPHLAAQSGKRFTGGADGGARNSKTEPSQLTEQDLARMSPDQIVKARKEGRFATLLGGTP